MRVTASCIAALLACASADITTDGIWAPLNSLPFGRSDMSIDQYPSYGSPFVYISGGCNGAQNCDLTAGFCACSSVTDNLVLYNAIGDNYTSMANMPQPRYRHISCGLGDAIYFFGGRTLATDTIIRDVDVYNVTTNRWTTLAPASNYPGGSDNGCFTIGDTIYLVGGYSPDYSESYNTTWAFTPRTGTWTTKAGQLRYGRGDFSAVSLNGKGYIYGGYQSGDFCSPLPYTEEYHPSNDTWTVKAPMLRNVAEKDAGMPLGGRVFAVGGERKARTSNCNDLDLTPVTDVMSFSPQTNSWRNETSMPDPRMRFASAVYGDDTLIVFGGQGPLSGGNTFPLKYTVYALKFKNTDNNGGSKVSYDGWFSTGSIVGAVIGTFLATLLAVVATILCYCYCTASIRKSVQREAARKLHSTPPVQGAVPIDDAAVSVRVGDAGAQ